MPGRLVPIAKGTQYRWERAPGGKHTVKVTSRDLRNTGVGIVARGPLGFYVWTAVFEDRWGARHEETGEVPLGKSAAMAMHAAERWLVNRFRLRAIIDRRIRLCANLGRGPRGVLPPSESS